MPTYDFNLSATASLIQAASPLQDGYQVCDGDDVPVVRTSGLTAFIAISSCCHGKAKW